MQSFLDVSLLAVTGGALLLLVLLLASFLILNRRCESLEKRISDQNAEITKLSETLKISQESCEALERRVKVADQTTAYLSDHAQKLDDLIGEEHSALEDLKSELIALRARLDEKVKHLVETRPENSPVIEARQLLREGMAPAEVASRTGLSSTEIEVIAKVIPRAQALKQAAAVTAGNVAGSAGDDGAGAVAGTEVEAEPVRHHVASLRARNAYGIRRH